MKDEYVVKQIESYKDYRKELECSMEVAKSLGHSIVVLSIKRDIEWCEEVISILKNINSKNK